MEEYTLGLFGLGWRMGKILSLLAEPEGKK